MSTNSTKRPHSQTFSDNSEDESIPRAVPLKRRKVPGHRPATKSSKALKGGPLGKDFRIILNDFRHQYSPLQEGQIRILIVKGRRSEDPNEPLDLELCTESLDAPVKDYEALSYEWGANFPRYPVAVRDNTLLASEQLAACQTARDKIRFVVRYECHRRARLDNLKYWTPKTLIRENLYNALMQFRRKDEDIRLWVDAICINQHNFLEKTKQIARMADIYNNASHVRIWLGVKSEEDGTDTAMRFVRQLANFESLSETLSSKNIDHKWVTLLNLMRSRWFSRRWVIQEQAVARKASIWCGKKNVDWTDFTDAVSIFRKEKDSIVKVLGQSPLGYSAILEVFDGLGATVMVRNNASILRKDLDGNIIENTRTLEELVTEFTSFTSSDPRDTIYGVMSIARPQGADFENIAPDYQKSLLDVYVDFVKFCIKISKKLDIICRHWAPVETTLKAMVSEMNAVGRSIFNFIEIESTLPSWIKKLDNSEWGTPDNIHRGRKYGEAFATLKPFYNASRTVEESDILYRFGTKTNSESEIEFTETYDGKLTVRGIILGKVRKVSQRIPKGIIPREVFEMGGWEYSQREDDHTVHEMPDQLWRTLVANQGPDGQPPTFYRRACLYALQRDDESGDVNIKDIVDHNQTPEVVRDYLRKVQDVCRNRKVFLAGLQGELFGLCSEAVEATGRDYICVIYGCSVPVILRKVKGKIPRIGQRRSSTKQGQRRGSVRPRARSLLPESPGISPVRMDSVSPGQRDRPEYFELIGECYVDGRMDGEALDIDEYKDTLREFILV
jgi:Heterokaryon incompatibility protein (HET)